MVFYEKARDLRGRPGRTSRRAGFGASTHFAQLFKNAFLRINLDQNMPKHVYFLEKSSIMATASGGGAHLKAPKPPRCFSHQLI